MEGLVGYARRNFLVPVPRAANWDELNRKLLEDCRQRRGQKIRGEKESIGERFERDREKLLPLPPAPHEACARRSTRASSQALVRFETNDYSVPVAYAHRRKVHVNYAARTMRWGGVIILLFVIYHILDLTTGHLNPQGDPATDTGDTTEPLPQDPRLEVVKSGTWVDGNGDGFADPGELVTYTFTVTNTGNVTLHDVVVTDPKVTVLMRTKGREGYAVKTATVSKGTWEFKATDLPAGTYQVRVRLAVPDPRTGRSLEVEVPDHSAKPNYVEVVVK